MKIPDGWPTDEMIFAAIEACNDMFQTDFIRAFKAALAAAPTPPAQGNEPVEWHVKDRAFKKYINGGEFYRRDEAFFNAGFDAGYKHPHPAAAPTPPAQEDDVNGCTSNPVVAQETGNVSDKQEDEPVEWRPVVDFEDLYEVSNQGRIRSKITGKLLSTNSLMGAGYVKADLWKEGKRTQTSVHRIVARAFLGEGEEVNHKNGDKTDNRLGNIEWSTRAANVNHSRYVLGNDVKPVVATCLQTGKETAFPSIEEAERSGGFDATCVSMCINGHKKTHKGHSWRLMSPANDTRPDNSELRKAAEEIESRLRNAGLEHDADYLRAALEGK
jgi:hypothetical protein